MRRRPHIVLAALLVSGCSPKTVATEEGSGATTSRADDFGYVLKWGDLHNHTNLSFDACEDPQNACLPRARVPGEDTFSRGAAVGIDFAAITDHAEYSGYGRSDTGDALDIWTRTQDLVRTADGGNILPILGFEWTGAYAGGGHRTVLLEDPDACAEYRRPARMRGEGDRPRPNGIETYTASSTPIAATPEQLFAALAEAAHHAGCRPTRVISYFHHTAYTRPKAVDWTLPANQVGDAVVEIFSEHGSSECADLGAEGCDWNISGPTYAPGGSIQTALELGLRLGFVGGTDNHRGSPGQIDTPSAHYGTGIARTQHNPGGLTGVLIPAGKPFDRAALFDAILARHTFATSRPLDTVAITAISADGHVYLPGDDVSAKSVTLRVKASDPAMQWIRVQVLDASGAILLDRAQAPVDEPLDLPRGEVRYVRLRYGIDGREQRLWASPFFGE